MQSIATRITSIAALVCVLALSATASSRHEVVYKGTVAAVDTKKITVTVVDEKTKKPEPMAFEHDHETKILRGDKVVTFAQAQIQKGEKVSVTINHDDAPEFALVIRLDAKKK